MSQTRIYLPLSGSGVRALAQDRSLPAPPLAAFAVTSGSSARSRPGTRRSGSMPRCARPWRASVLRESPVDKRVVAAADVDADWVSAGQVEGDALGAVEVAGQVALRHIVSFHIDEEPGADGAEDLLWYDATELDEVARLV